VPSSWRVSTSTIVSLNTVRARPKSPGKSAVGAQQQVGRLEVAMNDAAAVRKAQALRQLRGDVENALGVERLARLDAAGQAALLEEGHDEVRAFGPVRNFGNGHDVRMAQALEVSASLRKR